MSLNSGKGRTEATGAFVLTYSQKALLSELTWGCSCQSCQPGFFCERMESGEAWGNSHPFTHRPLSSSSSPIAKGLLLGSRNLMFQCSDGELYNAYDEPTALLRSSPSCFGDWGSTCCVTTATVSSELRIDWPECRSVPKSSCTGA